MSVFQLGNNTNHLYANVKNEISEVLTGMIKKKILKNALSKIPK